MPELCNDLGGKRERTGVHVHLSLTAALEPVVFKEAVSPYSEQIYIQCFMCKHSNYAVSVCGVCWMYSFACVFGEAADLHVCLCLVLLRFHVAKRELRWNKL